MKVLLHICCSNCVTYPFKMLYEEKHDITGFWFNPNIHPYEEYKLRLDSLKDLVDKWLINMYYIEQYNPEEFFRMFGANSLNGLNNNIKRPERCRFCYSLRLEKTAQEANRMGLDAFSTTLLISPYQDFEEIVKTGKRLADKHNIYFYHKDLRPYFRDSQSLSKEIGLYRQKYCGCIFSQEERRRKIKGSK